MPAESKTKQMGNIGELVSIAEFVKLGCIVSLPYGDNAPYDYIVEDSTGKLYKVQVKTSEKITKDGVYKFSLRKKRINKRKNITKRYDKNEVDLFVLYGLETNSLYIVSSSSVTMHDLRLRVFPPKKKGGTPIKSASDYEFASKIKEYMNI